MPVTVPWVGRDDPCGDVMLLEVCCMYEEAFAMSVDREGPAVD